MIMNLYATNLFAQPFLPKENFELKNFSCEEKTLNRKRTKNYWFNKSLF